MQTLQEEPDHTKQVCFAVPGEPKGKGRPRFQRAGGFVKTFTPEDTAVYENLVRLEYQNQTGGFMFPDGSELEMRIAAFYSIPKSASKKKRTMMIEGRVRPTKKPDMDNVVKVIADSLNNLAYHDDTQIVDCTVRKFYAEVPRVEVQITQI